MRAGCLVPVLLPNGDRPGHPATNRIHQKAPSMSETMKPPWQGREDDGALVGDIRTALSAAMWAKGRGMAAADFLDLLQKVIDDYRTRVPLGNN
jgi:hypothetical protein